MARQVSSANNVGSEDVLLYMSSIYIRNNSCPSVDPCGTPYEIFAVIEKIWLSVTYCFLPARYEFNNSCACPRIP